MTLVYMTFYEIRNRLYFSMSMLIMTILAAVIVFGILPISEQAMKNELKTTRFSVAFVDEEDSRYTQTAINELMETPSIHTSFEILSTDAQTAEKMLRANQVTATVTIPIGFIKGMQNGNHKEIQVLLNPNQPLYASLVKGGMDSGSYIMSAVQNVLYTFYSYISDLPLSNSEIDNLFNIEMFSMISQALNRDNIYERTTKTPWQDMEISDFYSISIVLLFMSLYSVGSIYQWHEKKRNGLLERMKFTCRSPIYVTYSNIFANSVMIFLQGVLIFVPLFFMRHGFATLKMLPFLYFISLNIATTVMLFATMIKNSTWAISAFVTFSLLCALASGNLIPFYFLPNFIPSEMKSFTPHYYWQQMLIYAHSQELSEQVRYSVIVLSITALLFVLLRGMNHEKFSNYKTSTKK